MKRISVVFLLLCGCTVGPDYDNPNDSIGREELLNFESFANEKGLWKSASPKDGEYRGNWWELFGDELLSKILEESRADNPDLKSLYYRVEQARENAKMSESALYPHAAASGDWFKTEVGDNSLLRPLGNRFEDWAIGATLTWDADLFGRIRSILAASRADAQALKNEYENALLSLQTKIAALYFGIREMESARILLEKTVEIRRGQTAMLRDRTEMGTASEADLNRALEQEFSSKAKLTDILQNIAVAKNLLANLLGTSPAKLNIKIGPLSGNPPDIPETLPSELLERRPDISAAERSVLAANHRIGAAQAAFFPTISITSSLGTESTAFSKLLNSSSFAWGVSPQIYMPIFQAGRLAAQKRVALARHKQALEDYKSTVLKAIRETEDALAKLNFTKSKVEELESASRAASRVCRIAMVQFEEGAADYFAASEAQRYSLMAELSLIAAKGEQFKASIDLIRAVGGSWKSEYAPTNQ